MNETNVTDIPLFEGNDEVAYFIISLCSLVFNHILTGILCLGGNSIVVYSIYKYPELRSPSNILICNLAVADLSSLIGKLLMLISFVIGKANNSKSLTESSRIYCTITLYSLSVANSENVFSLLCIMIDRFISIRYPLRYPALMTTKCAKLMILASWILDISINGLTHTLENKLMSRELSTLGISAFGERCSHRYIRNTGTATLSVILYIVFSTSFIGK